MGDPKNQRSGEHAATSDSTRNLIDAVGARREARMVLIPEGSFTMGAENGSYAEAPEHRVSIDAYWLDRTPVTNLDYLEFARETGYATEVEQAGFAWGFVGGKYQCISGLCWRSYATAERAEHPVVLVTWNDAAAYCAWADARLPTEAEWERAARAEQNGALFPWGNSQPDGRQSNFAVAPSALPGTTAVRDHPPNTLDLYDMVGNVWQWCADWYGEQYYAESPASNPAGPVAGDTRVRRGGSWNVLQPFRLRCSNRGAMPPAQTATNMGFRCARSIVSR